MTIFSPIPSGVLLFASLLLPGAASIAPGEHDALTELYRATGGSQGQWNKTDGWSETKSDPCDWHGVLCNTLQSAVISLNLSSNGLAGFVPSAMKKLLQLKTLDFSGNDRLVLTNSLPFWMDNLTASNGACDLSGCSTFCIQDGTCKDEDGNCLKDMVKKGKCNLKGMDSYSKCSFACEPGHFTCLYFSRPNSQTCYKEKAAEDEQCQLAVSSSEAEAEEKFKTTCCVKCAGGSFAETPGTKDCTQCQSGKFSKDGPGATSKTACQNCASNEKTIVANSSNCTFFKWQEVNGSVSADQCRCFKGPEGTYYDDQTTGTCRSCPAHMTCPGGDQVEPAHGYWRLTENATDIDAFRNFILTENATYKEFKTALFECFPQSACLGPDAAHPCEDEGCETHYQGFACGLCDRNSSKSMLTGECHQCSSPDVLTIIGVGMLSVSFLSWIVISAGEDPGAQSEQQNALTTATLTLGSNFVAVSAVVDLSALEEGLEGAPLNFVKLFNLQMRLFLGMDAGESVSYLCINDFFDAFLVVITSPFMCMLVLGMLVRIRHCIGFRNFRTFKLPRETQRRSLTEVLHVQSVDEDEPTSPTGYITRRVPWHALWLQTCVYIVLYACTAVVQYTVQISLPRRYPKESDFPDLPSSTRVSYYPGLEFLSKAHNALLSASLIVVSLIVILVVTIFARMVQWRRWRYLQSLISVDFLQKPFKRSSLVALNWEMVLLCRRTIIVVLILTRATNPSLEAVLINVMLFCSFGMQTHWMPFESMTHNVFELVSLLSNFVLYNVVKGLGPSLSRPEQETLIWCVYCVRFIMIFCLVLCMIWENQALFKDSISWLCSGCPANNVETDGMSSGSDDHADIVSTRSPGDEARDECVLFAPNNQHYGTSDEHVHD